MLSHQKLKVYAKGLAVVTSLGRHSVQWNKHHSVVDQLCRASESIVHNLVEAVRGRGSGRKRQFLNYAVGSSLECAACVDIAVIKQFLALDSARKEKQALGEVVRMLVGLGRSWEKNALHEDPPIYGGSLNPEPSNWYFAHEPLQVYQSSLSFMRWFTSLPAGTELATRLCRHVDKAATSLMLNLAEAYGRAQGDRLRFLELAESSATKAAAYLDLCVSKAELNPKQPEPGIDLLSHIVLMLRALIGDDEW